MLHYLALMRIFLVLFFLGFFFGLFGVGEEGLQGENPALSGEDPAVAPTPPESLFVKAERHYSHKKYPLALELLKQVVKENATNGLAHFYLGNIFFLQKEHAAADRHYGKALDLLPSRAEVLLNYASLKYAQKLFDVAEVFYHKAKRQHPHLPQAYERLAMIYYRQLQFEKSAAAFETLLAKFPDRNDRENIERWIIKLREHSGEAEEIRNELLSSGQEIDALKFKDIFSLDLKNISKEKEFESKNAETIKDFDVDLEILE